MNKKKFIYNHPLELSLPTKESEAFRRMLKRANESYVLEVKEEFGITTETDQYYNFYVSCPTTNFANAYFHVGILYAKYVLPIWKKRHNLK